MDTAPRDDEIPGAGPAGPAGDLARLVEELARGEARPEDLRHALGDDAAAPRSGDHGPLDYARLDHGRPARQGMPEVVYGAGKTADQIVGIVSRLLGEGHPVLVTRLDADTHAACRDGLGDEGTYDPLSRTWLGGDVRAARDDDPAVVVVSAGTSDLPVAEEAARTAEAFGQRVVRLTDVGVAGLHRLLAHLPELRAARVVVAVAGMEGALPSVAAGLVACPVVAVPTSVGYGASFGGVAALLAMLNSCASGVTVVNIDNGFGAACAAVRIAAAVEAAGPATEPATGPAAGPAAGDSADDAPTGAAG